MRFPRRTHGCAGSSSPTGSARQPSCSSRTKSARSSSTSANDKTALTASVSPRTSAASCSSLPPPPSPCSSPSHPLPRELSADKRSRVGCIHSDLPQSKRDAVVEKFRSGDIWCGRAFQSPRLSAASPPLSSVPLSIAGGCAGRGAFTFTASDIPVWRLTAQDPCGDGPGCARHGLRVRQHGGEFRLPAEHDAVRAPGGAGGAGGAHGCVRRGTPRANADFYMRPPS